MSYREIMSPLSKKIKTFVSDLIKQGHDLEAERFTPPPGAIRTGLHVNVRPFSKWQSSCKLLVKHLGTFGEPWADVLQNKGNSNQDLVLQLMIGALESILENLKKGRLVAFEDIIRAEALGDLVEQGNHLSRKGYYLPAAVVFRAVLEERLRKLCQVHRCLPSKKAPTINDYNQSLYSASVYDLSMMKNVEAMAAIGNKAAHATGNVEKQEVQRFGRDLKDFLVL
jgi:hypothetical protein